MFARRHLMLSTPKTSAIAPQLYSTNSKSFLPRRDLLWLLILGFYWCSSTAAPASTACTYKYDQLIFNVDDKSIFIERYTPFLHSAYGIVFMLHGSAGAYTVSTNHEPSSDNFGEKSLAQHCYLVLLPHYFGVLGVSSLTSQKDIAAATPKLLRAVNVLLDDTESLYLTHDIPVLLYGESLGAYLAMSLALTRTEVHAVSEISGGLFDINSCPAHGRRLAVLVSHGAQDTIVPVSEAFRVRSYCLMSHYSVTMDIYKEIGHYFPPQQKLRCVDRTEALFESQRHSR